MSDIAFACVLVTVPNENTITQSDVTTYGQQNVNSVDITANKGVYDVSFAPVFSDYPVVNVTQFFNGHSSGGHLNSVTQNVGYASGAASDNATGVFVEHVSGSSYRAQVVTGNAGGQLWRSFALSAMGPAAPK